MKVAGCRAARICTHYRANYTQCL